MTKTNIMKAINEVNTNKDIKWSITKNTKNEIMLTNSYGKDIKYSITVKSCEGDEWIKIRNEHMDTGCGMLLQGNDKWSDYTDTENGLEMAVKSVVRNFNYFY